MYGNFSPRRSMSRKCRRCVNLVGVGRVGLGVVRESLVHSRPHVQGLSPTPNLKQPPRGRSISRARPAQPKEEQLYVQEIMYRLGETAQLDMDRLCTRHGFHAHPLCRRSARRLCRGAWSRPHTYFEGHPPFIGLGGRRRPLVMS